MTAEHVGPAPGHTIEDEFRAFHEANPLVYQRLVSLARELAGKGHRNVGMAMLFEVLRWQHLRTTTRDAHGFKLNNNYRSYYARLLTYWEPDLRGMFTTRELHGPEFDPASVVPYRHETRSLF